MSFGQDLLKLAPSAAVGVGSDLIGSMIGAITQRRQAKKQFQYNQKLMEQQHAYELENMSELEKIQRQLALDSPLLKKRGLQQAGYSTADPDNQGAQIGAVSPSTSASAGFSMPTPPGSYGYSSSISNISNAQLVSSQARLNDIEAQYRAKKLGQEIELTKSKIKEINQTLQPRIEQIIMDINNKRKDLHLKDEQVNEIKARIANLAESTTSISIDNKYKDQLNESTLNRMFAETRKLMKEGDIKGIEAELAKVGILVNSNFLTQILAVLHQGTSTDLLNDLVSGLTGILGELPGAMAQVFTGMIQSMADTVTSVPKAVWEKIKSFIPGKD